MIIRDTIHDFARFFESLYELFADSDDPEKMAEALANEDFKRAQELSGLTEEEFVEVLEGLAR